jgi:hypothetical protein
VAAVNGDARERARRERLLALVEGAETLDPFERSAPRKRGNEQPEHNAPPLRYLDELTRSRAYSWI